MKTKKKRAPQDSTMRNVRAVNKRLDKLDHRSIVNRMTIEKLCDEVIKINGRLMKLEKKRGKR